MKLVLTVCFGALLTLGNCQVPITFKNGILLRVMDSIIVSSRIKDNEKGVITLNFENREYRNVQKFIDSTMTRKVFQTHQDISHVLRVAIRQDKIFFKYNIPTFYSTYKNRLVLIYTGTEELINFEAPCKRLYKRLERILPASGGRVFSPIWWIRIDDNGFSVIGKL